MNQNDVSDLNVEDDSAFDTKHEEPFSQMPGVIPDFGNMSSETLITEEALAKIFKRHPGSIKRAVQRGELPPPIKLLGVLRWTIGVLRQHFEKSQNNAAEESQKMAQRVAKMSF